MFKSIISNIKQDKDYPERAFMIDMYTRVLKGEIYDHLSYPFNCEKNNAGEYIPIMQRRPSVRCNIAKKVVNDSVSMLFSDGHFPQFDSEDEIIRTTLTDITKESHLNLKMIEAATKGSVGSVAIILRILSNKFHFEPMSTKNLTPTFDSTDPSNLISVREQYKVKGIELNKIGYNVDETVEYWFTRDWDVLNEIFYKPIPVRDYNSSSIYVPENAKEDATSTKLSKDLSRSVNHRLGFVPIVWIKNLPNGDDIDGECTFLAAIDTIFEIDYQLSQVGRGLRYSSDPTLLIKEPAAPGSDIIKGSGSALLVDKDGDAKYLEIDGGASNAVLEYVKRLREYALESINGNRTNPEKISAAQSGVAMKHLNQDLIYLVDKLRITYGECGLLNLLKMIIKASKKYKVLVNGKQIPELDENAIISLRWPDWYPPTNSDKQQEAGTLKTLKDAAIISRETAVKTIAGKYDIEDIEAEIIKIDADQKAQQELLQPKTTETIAA